MSSYAGEMLLCEIPTASSMSSSSAAMASSMQASVEADYSMSTRTTTRRTSILATHEVYSTLYSHASGTIEYVTSASIVIPVI